MAQQHPSTPAGPSPSAGGGAATSHPAPGSHGPGSVPASRRNARDQVRKQVRTQKGPLGSTAPERSQENRSD